MNLLVKTIFSVICVTLVLSITKTEAANYCDATELIESNQHYTDHKCSGINSMQERNYEEAIKAFQAALAINLFDAPNFELLPWLALAYFKAGNLMEAENILAKSEISLSIFTGILKCNEVEDGFFLIDQYGARFTGEFGNEVGTKMCGAAYDHVYARNSLRRVLLETKLVEHYFSVKQQVR